VSSLGVDYVQGYYLGKPQSTLEPLRDEASESVGASVA